MGRQTPTVHSLRSLSNIRSSGSFTSLQLSSFHTVLLVEASIQNSSVFLQPKYFPESQRALPEATNKRDPRKYPRTKRLPRDMLSRISPVQTENISDYPEGLPQNSIYHHGSGYLSLISELSDCRSASGSELSHAPSRLRTLMALPNMKSIV